jgi:hypothetical protein
MAKKQKDTQPRWVCLACGKTHGKRMCGVATWHPDTCGVCGKSGVSVTEPRDFGYLENGWSDKASATPAESAE